MRFESRLMVVSQALRLSFQLSFSRVFCIKFNNRYKLILGENKCYYQKFYF